MSLFDYLNQMNPNTAETQKALFNALINFVAETKDIHADSVNPFHNSKYASLSAHLEVLKPLAAKHGLAIIQMPTGTEGTVGVSTLVIHKDGGYIKSDADIPAEKGISGQQAGILYSYIRRYSLASIAGCATDDDDAELDRQIRTKAPAAKKAYVAPSAAPASASAPAFTPKSAEPAGDVLVPFGDHKGKPLSSLPLVEPNREVKFGDLTYFAKRWTPKPFGDNPNPSARDLKVKAEAQRLFEKLSSGGATTTDEIPF